jgi:hypothetical protein
MSKVLKPDTVEEYERLLQAALEQRVVVQPFGNYQLIVPNEWKPPRALKVEADSPKSEPEPDKTSTSARSSNKEVG